jgi:hypothetical protein
MLAVELLKSWGVDWLKGWFGLKWRNVVDADAGMKTSSVGICCALIENREKEEFDHLADYRFTGLTSNIYRITSCLWWNWLKFHIPVHLVSKRALGPARIKGRGGFGNHLGHWLFRPDCYFCIWQLSFRLLVLLNNVPMLSIGRVIPWKGDRICGALAQGGKFIR